MPPRLKDVPSGPRNSGHPGRVWSTLPEHCPAVPHNLDVGVIYSGERNLMGPLLSTMKASAPGLNYRLILVNNHSHDGIEPWRRSFRKPRC